MTTDWTQAVDHVPTRTRWIDLPTLRLTDSDRRWIAKHIDEHHARVAAGKPLPFINFDQRNY